VIVIGWILAVAAFAFGWLTLFSSDRAKSGELEEDADR